MYVHYSITVFEAVALRMDSGCISRSSARFFTSRRSQLDPESEKLVVCGRFTVAADGESERASPELKIKRIVGV